MLTSPANCPLCHHSFFAHMDGACWCGCQGTVTTGKTDGSYHGETRRTVVPATEKWPQTLIAERWCSTCSQWWQEWAETGCGNCGRAWLTDDDVPL